MMILFTYEVDIALRNVSWKSIVIDIIFQDRERTLLFLDRLEYKCSILNMFIVSHDIEITS